MRRRGITGGGTSLYFVIFTCLAMAECVVFVLALYITFSGLPVPFCIDLAILKCLEQKQYSILSKILMSSPRKKNTPAALSGLLKIIFQGAVFAAPADPSGAAFS